jgi:hypothetical protein
MPNTRGHPLIGTWIDAWLRKQSLQSVCATMVRPRISEPSALELPGAETAEKGH